MREGVPPLHLRPQNDMSAPFQFRHIALALILGFAPAASAVELPGNGTGHHIRIDAPTPPLDDLGLLLRDDKNPILNEFWFLGRYHGQYHWSEGTNGSDEGWENRRFRIGGQMRLFKNLTLHAQMVSGPDMEPFYNGFTELWASWRFNDAVILTVGQQKHRFTHDRNVSSRYLNYLERSQLTNMFTLDYTPAITLSGRAGKWSYYTGIFSNATGTDMWRAFTELDSGWSYLASATVELGEAFHTEGAFLNVSYVHSEANRRATNLNVFRDGAAAALILTEGPMAFVTEVTAGIGSDNGNAIGLNFQPSIHLTDKLQLVGRYQIASSDDDNGLRAQRRYERPAGLRTGDLYQAAYVGLNYHVIGHRLKLMTGVEYSTLGGRDVWTASCAVRLFWGPHSRGPFPMAQVRPGLFR